MGPKGRIPATVLLPQSGGVWWGVAPPQHCKWMVKRLWIQFNALECGSLSRVQNPWQIVAKMVKNRGLEGVWGASGRLLGVFWLQGPVARFLDAFLGESWTSWAPLGRLLGPSW